jgi:hypothetical protein
MRGANGVRDKLADLVRAEVPRKIPLLRTAWALDDVGMPDLESVVSGEAPDGALTSAGDNWVLVVNPRLLNTHRVDIVAGLPVYMTRYSCRIYTWAKADSWPLAVQARDNLAVACRLALFEYPNLSNTVRGDTGYRSYENTYTEEFGEPLRVNNNSGRVWAGAVLAIDVDCEETLKDGSTRAPIGTNNTTTTTATAVGSNRPLPGGK